MLAKKGQIPLYVTFFGLVILSLGLGWVYLKDQNAFGGLNLPLDFLKPPVTINTTGWKQFETADHKLNFLYPPDWYLNQDQYISQYPFTPNINSNNVSNAISVNLIVGQIQTSYANEDWFNRLYNAKTGDTIRNEFHPSDQIKFNKMDSGKTLKGSKFVLFKNHDETQVQAYLSIANTQIYQFTLKFYDNPGLDNFKKIISTATPI